MRALLLSNSTNYGESYMQWCANIIADFLKDNTDKAVFIPFAGVGFSHEEYTNRVNTALSEYGIEVLNISTAEDSKKLLEEATAILVGGGNTFHLLHQLQDQGLLELIQNKVKEGTPYVGWSAGSNIAGPSIKTTNDMPIIEPQSFNALNLINYQINPHYTEKTIPDHGGESRMQRLQEFIAANRSSRVACLPEASYLMLNDSELRYKGGEKGFLLSDLGIDELHDGALLELTF